LGNAAKGHFHNTWVQDRATTRIFVVAEAESEEAAQAAILNIPDVRDGWFDVEIDPIHPFRSGLAWGRAFLR
jgi:hypothetical protein